METHTRARQKHKQLAEAIGVACGSEPVTQAGFQARQLQLLLRLDHIQLALHNCQQSLFVAQHSFCKVFFFFENPKFFCLLLQL